MIGDMIAKARKDKNMTKTQLAKLIKVDIGHITHIEKGERDVYKRQIYRWREKYDGTRKSLVNKSRRPKSHPNEHTEKEIILSLIHI